MASSGFSGSTDLPEPGGPLIIINSVDVNILF